jgi:hypothetical protein
MMPPGGVKRIDQRLFTQVPRRRVLIEGSSHALPTCSKSKVSLSLTATLGEEPEVEVALV